MSHEGTDGDGKNPHSFARVDEYLVRVQEQLITHDDAWLVYIETNVSYTLDSTNKEVRRTGGTTLRSRAHGAIADLTVRNDNGDEIVTFVEPGASQPWGVAKILREAAGLK